MPLEFKKLTAKELQALPRDRTAFFFPVGSPEDHGPHLPLGLDLFEAQKICEMAAVRLERQKPDWVGVLMPEASLGIESVTRACVVTVRSHVLRDWLVDASLSLMKQGFGHFVCFSGSFGPRQLTAIEDAGKIIFRKALFKSALRLFRNSPWVRPSLVSASSALISARQVRSSPFWLDPEEHGGAHDTSVGLIACPEEVKFDFQALPLNRRPDFPRERAWKWWRGETAGYWGDPSKATIDAGKQILEEKVDQVFPKLLAVWEGANPNHLFRSWYSVIPMNKSQFKAWLLATAFVALMSFWIYVNFQALVSGG